MSYFYKGIFYIDLYEKEEKKKNIGFVKIIVKEEKCSLQIQVKGMPPTDTLQCIIKELETQKEIDTFMITNGQGDYMKTFWEEKIGDSQIKFQEMRGVYLGFSNKRYGIAQWNEEIRKEEKLRVMEEPLLTEVTPLTEATPLIEEPPLTKEDTPSENEGVVGDKWEQLCNMFKEVYPFSKKEEEKYITIAPRDFVILQSKYQGLVDNSFLLHGYYNYHHIVLGKRKENNTNRYYIGVPGNYYAREKAVAVMFGFEGFECENKQKRGMEEPVPQGTFGYYMCPVEI